MAKAKPAARQPAAPGARASGVAKPSRPPTAFEARLYEVGGLRACALRTTPHHATPRHTRFTLHPAPCTSARPLCSCAS
jgi:hypothetical protein